MVIGNRPVKILMPVTTVVGHPTSGHEVPLRPYNGGLVREQLLELPQGTVSTDTIRENFSTHVRISWIDDVQHGEEVVLDPELGAHPRCCWTSPRPPSPGSS